MGKQAQPGRFAPQSASRARRPAQGLTYLLLAAVCLVVAVAFYWLSRKNSAARRQEAAAATQHAPRPISAGEELTPYPVVSRPAPSTRAAASGPADDSLSGAYTVVPARAYFHSEPRATSSTGKYVLRGDVIYAEAESEAFIKTRFFNSVGDPVAGWLKKAELRAKAVSTNARPLPRPPRTRPAHLQVGSTPENPTAASPAPATAAAARREKIAATGTVRVDTTYFHDSPNLTQRRRAFCIRGDKMKLSDSSEKAVFATFVNWEKVKTTGWIKKKDLRIKQ